MAFFGVQCFTCQSKKKVFRKRRSGIRYAQLLDASGIAVGESRYYQLQCHHCESLFYLEERHYYENSMKLSEKHIVPETTFQRASLHKPGILRIGTTASQYTVRIASGADSHYALNRLV